MRVCLRCGEPIFDYQAKYEVWDSVRNELMHFHGQCSAQPRQPSRAELAARAMQGILSEGMLEKLHPDKVAFASVVYADALIERLNKDPEAELNKPSPGGD